MKKFILIFSGGKTGSSTLVTTFQKNGFESTKIHNVWCLPIKPFDNYINLLKKKKKKKSIYLIIFYKNILKINFFIFFKLNKFFLII